MKQNFISELIFKADKVKNMDQIIKKIIKETDFKIKKIVNKSFWWSSKKFGAIHISGWFKNKKAVLKIELVKPDISEFTNIKKFNQQNKSNLIRTPKIFLHLPWLKNNKYEVIIMEDVGKKTVVVSPTTKKNIQAFFKIYQEYKKNCLNKPWLDYPTFSLSKMIEKNFKKWIKIRKELYLNHPYVKKNDFCLIHQAIQILKYHYKNVKYQFGHGHLGQNDLYWHNNQVVILSNLYWGWRAPFYDAIFCYHWFIYHLAKKQLSKKKVIEQKNIWLEEIFRLAKNKKETKLINLALLERTAAGLNLDALSIDINLPLAKFLVEITREELKRLIKIF